MRAVLAVCCCSACMGFQLQHSLSTAAQLATTTSFPVPTTTALSSMPQFSDSDQFVWKTILRDPVDIYYGIIAAVALFYLFKNFATGQLDSAKAQDEAIAKSNKQLTDAFRQAREKK